MSDLVEAYQEFWDDLLRDAESSGEPQQACFFDMYSQVAAENGDCTDLAYTPARREGQHGYQVDGYSLDPESGELHLAACDFRPEQAMQSLNQSRIDQMFRRAERFVTMSLESEFVASLEETSPAFEVAHRIYNNRGSIGRVRIIIFTNARLATRKKGVEAKQINGRTFTLNLLDFIRYDGILGSRSGAESIEIDLTELNGVPLQCLKAHGATSGYASYLIALPGELLAKIYGLYGARLLEQNVRTFLQARTKVNRGIIQTLEQSPGMFFAYNNGITATASDISTKQLEDGTTAIESINNLQIVNGGQTTASILYAKDKMDADLTNVYVQMKLSVIDPAEIAEVVPKISKYANTQNRISEADFFSSHPFHLEMEKVSRRLAAPQKAGAFATTKWFYERARGQYKDKLAYGTAATRKRFQTEFPKDQVIVKTDIAKYALTLEQKPHLVSQGAQKCFLNFAEQIGESWDTDPNFFNEMYFKDLVAKAILFRWTDSMVGRSAWYQEDRGYKAQTVTYTIAWLSNFLERDSLMIDLRRIWEIQDLTDDLKHALEQCAPAVAGKIKTAPVEIRNIGEYCKRQSCWAATMELQIRGFQIKGNWAINRQERKQREKESRGAKRLDNELEFESRLYSLGPQAEEIRKFAKIKKLLSPKGEAALNKVIQGKLTYTNSDKNALRYLLERVREAGFEVGPF